MTRFLCSLTVLGLFLAITGCSDGGGKIIAPKDTRVAPPPPTSPAGGAPKLPSKAPE